MKFTQICVCLPRGPNGPKVVDDLSDFKAILIGNHGRVMECHGYGSKLGTPIIGWLILN